MDGGHKALDRFKQSCLASGSPLLKDLCQHITPVYAADWKVIGTLLNVPSGELRAIEVGQPTNVEWCCNQMLEKWLEMDTTATWERLFTVIESSAVSSADKGMLDVVTAKLDEITITSDLKGSDAITILSNRVRQVNVQARFIDDDNVCPPEQPKHLTPLLFVHYQGHRTVQQVKTMAKLMYTGEIGKVAMVNDDHPGAELHPKLGSHPNTSHASITTKEISEVLVPLENSKEPCFILIEGAPGIGKSVFLKEIAYRWSKRQLLQKYELVLLLYLRDPTLQQATSIDDLLQPFLKGDKNAPIIVSACSEYLLNNGGKSLTLLIDGYDECPGNLKENRLMTAIIERQVLPQCGLVISSRPHASEHLRKIAAVKVEILGFTETERDHDIKQALQSQPDKIEELTHHLSQHSSINSIYCDEAGGHTMCDTTQQVKFFRSKTISIRNTNLSASNMDCISRFLTSSPNKEWMILNLWNCCIQDHGLCFLYQGLIHSDITINELWLGSNLLTVQSASMISEIVLNCKVKVLGMNVNDNVGESSDLYSIFTHQDTVVEELNMSNTGLSSTAATYLFTALKDNRKLKVLNVVDNAIGDDACDAIATTLEKNDCLVKLHMYGNALTYKSLVAMVQSLQVNNTLEFLGLPYCAERFQKFIKFLQESLNQRRENKGYKVKLDIQFSTPPPYHENIFIGPSLKKTLPI